MEQVGKRLAELAPADADLADVAAAIVDVVDMPHGTRPFPCAHRPADDGAAVAERIRAEFLTGSGSRTCCIPTPLHFAERPSSQGGAATLAEPPLALT